MCLNNETWSLTRLSFKIRIMVYTFRNCFSPAYNGKSVDRAIKWNNNNFSCVIFLMSMEVVLVLLFDLDLGESLKTLPAFIPQASQKPSKSHMILCLLNFMLSTKASHWLKTWESNSLFCYSDLLQCEVGPNVKYHVHIVLIQYIKKFTKNNISFCHTLKERN
jgi:hypothetical protein